MARVIAALLILTLSGCASVGSSLLNAVSGDDTVTERADISYGPAPRMAYDLYTPDDPTGPILIYVHGGSWDEGDKGIYRFLGTGFAGDGLEVAIPNYRLSPEVVFPAFVEDIALAVREIRDDLGPDRPLFLMGHSAGAQIASLIAYDPRYLAEVGLDQCVIAGFIGVSGPYDFLPIINPRYKRVFPEDTRPESQAINFADGPKPPSLLLHGTADVIVHEEDSILMAQALSDAGNLVELKRYEGNGHIDIISATSDLLRDDAPTHGDVMAFISAYRSAAPRPGC
ncbi:acetyl esterase/lipase [Rubricella aquisinus]|uniref:Acetyl esterase/lipase n=1 Tax=Rubricella aquisinus TaxID=2028108 RepID=A0A840WN35_9RHOB|nr:alpha/beta hydrolase [Rubricella aquisinus]MBB5515503.1 acetyl esterase/lipase [Rubricella aquisinus]